MDKISLFAFSTALGISSGLAFFIDLLFQAVKGERLSESYDPILLLVVLGFMTLVMYNEIKQFLKSK